jgi:primosomal protein N' (replication factor Y)
LGETLRRGEQAILFLNRRGAASSVICRDCGYVMRCPNDDTPLTLHVDGDLVSNEERSGNRQSAIGNRQLLRCHQCDHTEPVPARCPACGSARIRFIGIGTQRIEQAIHEHFPQARAVRWDRDAASKASADQMLQRFINRQADALVGTQMIAKGLDLPLVTLVGVVMADVGMFLPDFRASERVFNLLEQVAGRAGRGLLPGRVIVQTYNPEAPAVAYAARHDVQGFVRQELAQRKVLRLPPFVRLVRFEFADEDEAAARQACEVLARHIRGRAAQPADLIGPAQAYFTRRNKRYRWQLFVRTSQPSELLDGLDIPRGCVVDVDPISVL